MSGRSLVGSIALHGSFILFLIYLHQAVRSQTSMAEASPPLERIYYRVPVLDSSKVMPHIAPAGPGGRPGNAIQPQAPALGSSVAIKNLIAVSKPVHPDNNRQTIWQRTSPPDLRIPNEITLPMIALGNPDLPKPALKIVPEDSKAIQVKRALTTANAPVVPDTPSQAAVIPMENPTLARPSLTVPMGEPSKAIQKERGDQPAPSAPDIQGKGDKDLLVMGVDSANPMSKIALPPGNRWGDFSLSPAGGRPGSPGGISNSSASGGASGTEGPGGEGSVGIGAGKSGGGGDPSNSLPVSIGGSGSGPAGNGLLSGAPTTVEAMIVPVLTTPHIRKNALVVTGGPIGGGGLGVYKALSCGKIYTVFVTMPGANWSVEYCPRADPNQPPPPPVASTVVHLESPVLPPDATVKFDFLRMPVSEDKKRKLIVLKGVVDETGAVTDVEVYSGLLPAMDEAARTAFSRWKFMPALRNGKPIAVDVLVGIMATLPGTQ